MSILLTGVKIRGATIRPMDFGGLLTPSLGGASQRVNRMGNRYAIDIELPPLPEEPDGRLFTALLEQAMTQGAIFPVPQLAMKTLAAGSPVVGTAVTTGSSVALTGLTPNFMFRTGQFISFIHLGRRYLHRLTSTAYATQTGTVTIPIMPLLRTALSVGDVVEVEKPMIEGWIDIPSWNVLTAPFTSTRFSITEAA